MRSRSKSLTYEEKIERLTGWMQFDIDSKDNPNMTNAASLRDELRNMVYVAFCSVSASGRGVWGLVKVSDPTRYRDHFRQLKLDFHKRGIKLDPSNGSNCKRELQMQKNGK
jgi:hypothetical protein